MSLNFILIYGEKEVDIYGDYWEGVNPANISITKRSGYLWRLLVGCYPSQYFYN